MASCLKKLISSKQAALSRNFTALQNIPGSTAHGSNINGRYELHITAPRSYPCAMELALPDNFQDINASEVGCFSPLRSRDISGSVLSSQDHHEINERFPKIDITVDSDPHIGPYDCRGAVSLSSSMQSNVPSPFGGQGSILGMPGSQWGQGYKYLSDYRHDSHYLNLRNKYSRALHSARPGTACSYHTSLISFSQPLNTNLFTSKYFHVGDRSVWEGRRALSDAPVENKPPSRAEKLKQAVAAYGSTVIVFHVTISLASLGGCYLLVSSGLDVMALMDHLGLADSTFTKKVTANAGTFVVAYAVHKVFAPVRIGITLTATPFIVRYLRRIGILKSPKPQA